MVIHRRPLSLLMIALMLSLTACISPLGLSALFLGVETEIQPAVPPDNLINATAFERIIYTRSGGITGQTLTIIVYADGQFFVNDQPVEPLLPETIAMLDQMVIAADVAQLDTQYGPSDRGADIYTYNLSVTDHDGSETIITAIDGYVPPALQQIFNTLQRMVPR